MNSLSRWGTALAGLVVVAALAGPALLHAHRGERPAWPDAGTARAAEPAPAPVPATTDTLPEEMPPTF